MSTKTAAGLVSYAKLQLGKPYWYGCFGQKPTLTLLDQKRAQYPATKSYLPAGYAQHRAEIGKFDRVHDCVGLIKGYLWSETHDSAPMYNALQDVSADGMYDACPVKGGVATLPDTPGTLVFIWDSAKKCMPHVGVYTGGGLAAEARGSDYGVVQTRVAGRGWTHWGRCPWVDYGEPVRLNAGPTAALGLKIGDAVRVARSGVPYYPGGVNIPNWVRGRVYTVADLSQKGGVPAALLSEITSYCAVANLEKVGECA